MSSLVVNTIFENMEAERVYSGNGRVPLCSIIPMLYFHGVSTGSIRLIVSFDGEEIGMKELLISDIRDQLSGTGNYFYCYVPFVFDQPILVRNGEYKFKIEVPSFPNEQFIGWISQHEDIQTEINYNVIGDINNPLTIRFKQYREGIL
jgi:hypothetical protein